VTSQTGPDPQCPDCVSPWVMLLPPSHGAVWQKPAALSSSHLAHPSPCKRRWSTNYVCVNLTLNLNGIFCLRKVIINRNTVPMPILPTAIFNIPSEQSILKRTHKMKLRWRKTHNEKKLPLFLLLYKWSLCSSVLLCCVCW